jgi:hypothetical protein
MVADQATSSFITSALEFGLLLLGSAFLLYESRSVLESVDRLPKRQRVKPVVAVIVLRLCIIGFDYVGVEDIVHRLEKGSVPTGTCKSGMEPVPNQGDALETLGIDLTDDGERKWRFRLGETITPYFSAIVRAFTRVQPWLKLSCLCRLKFARGFLFPLVAGSRI